MICIDQQEVELFLVDQQEFGELSVQIVMLLQTSDSRVLHWRVIMAN
jgi:hypothetical protein